MHHSTTAVLAVALTFSMLGTSDAETLTFQANLVADNVIAGGSPGSASTATGTASFVLEYDAANPSATTLSYDIQIVGADLDGSQTPDLNDDITAIHLHDLNTCMATSCVPGDSAGTLHTLNIFGMPRNDDADMMFFPADGRVTGLWDASDANNLMPAPSFAPEEFVDELKSGELFLMLHTREFSSGAFGGQLVPEPGSAALLLCGLPIAGWLRRRRG